LTESDLSDDVQKIRQFYQAVGFFNTVVTYTIKQKETLSPESTSKKPTADQLIPPLYAAEVEFKVEEGPRVYTKRIDIAMKGKTAGIDSKQIYATLLIKEEQPFEIEKYRASKTAIVKEFGKRGYPFSQVSGNVTVDIHRNIAIVVFDIAPGDRKKFGKLTIRQKELPVKDVVIRRAVTFKPGEVFDAAKVEKSQRNLYDLDVFKSAMIKIDDPPPIDEEIPMNLELKSKKPQTVKFGLGYGSEDGIRVKSGWTYRNLGGWAGRLSLNAKRSDLYEGIWGDYTQPYFLDSENHLRSGMGIEDEKLDSYENLKTYGNVNVTRKLVESWEALIGYNLEANRLKNIRVINPEELQAFERDHNYWISSVTFGIVRNTTDDEINPTKGRRMSILVETASESIGSNLSFVKPDLEIKEYLPLPFQSIFACRIRLQSLRRMGNTDYIPIFKRLFLGGSNTVRGYGYQQLGPIDDTGNPLGGLSSMNANIELRRRIHESFSGVIFLDMGRIEEKSFHYDLTKIRYSSGVGIRYDTPVGPVRVDWGYKLTPSADEKKDLWRLHFSIGQAF
jgi:outer membrane protein assembly complex protein YaeT